MGARPQAMRVTGRVLAAVMVYLTVAPTAMQAQRGLSSPVAQVTLVAHIAPGAAFHGARQSYGTAHRGSLREASVRVRLSANTRYRLVVLGTASAVPGPGEVQRVWVRADNGEFRELTPGSSVTVTHDARSGGDWEHEVSYRIDAPGQGTGSLQRLPVRYEIRVDPTL